MHVSRLRRKLAQEEQVKTVRGVGYQLVVIRNYVDSKG